jgi:hypothetical protein
MGEKDSAPGAGLQGLTHKPASLIFPNIFSIEEITL